MTVEAFLSPQLSRALRRHALRACPPPRLELIRAAANELDYVTSPTESLIWSIGIVRASYWERLRSMSIASPLISKPVLLLEALICFLPVSFFWSEISLDVITGLIPRTEGLLLITSAMVGPLGMASFGELLLGKAPIDASFRAFTLALLVAWAAVVEFILPLTSSILWSLPWRDGVLLLLLPLAAVGHYSFLACNTSSSDTWRPQPAS